MRKKRRRTSEAPSTYYKALQSSIPAQHELRERVVSHLVTHAPAEFQLSNGALRSSSDGKTFNLDDAGDP